MSAIPVIKWLAVGSVVGFIYLILCELITSIVTLGIHETESAFPLLNYLWLGFPALWFTITALGTIREYNKKSYRSGGIL